MIGQTVSHYKILEKLGEGGMGVVYKAEDTKLKRMVALKFLSPQAVGTKEEKTRFKHEAQSAAALNHSTICTVHEIGDYDNQTFIVMEYVEGLILKDAIKSDELSIDDVIRIAIDVGEGLQEAHGKGIVHRDIKPGNIMVTDKKTAKILDFGLAKLAGMTKVTQTGMTVGTVAYMSPEQARGEAVDHRSDIWSLGVVLYEMLTGQLPFKSDYEQAMIYSVLHETPEPVTAHRSGVPAELQRIVARAMAKDPMERYQQMGELLLDLKMLRDAMAGGGAVAPSRRRHGRRLLAYVLAAAVVVAVLFIGLKIRIGREPPAVAAENKLAVMYFDNLADPADTGRLGEIVTNLLITDLSESQYMQVVSSQRLHDILKQLGSGYVKVVDRDLASQVAKKANAKWMLLGSILQIKPQLVVTSQLVEVANGDAVASQKIKGEAGEDVFSLVDKLTIEIKNDLSLPAAAKEEPDRPVADVTTSSPEAYRHYIDGLEYSSKGYGTEASTSFEKAIEHDSTFAMAFYHLSYHVSSRSEAGRIIRLAVKYSDKSSHKEQMLIEARRTWIEEKYDLAIPILQKLIERYPDERQAHMELGMLYWSKNNRDSAIHHYKRAAGLDSLDPGVYGDLAYIYEELGDFENSLWAINKSIALDPDNAGIYSIKADIYAFTGKLDQAIDTYKKALDIKPDLPYTVRKLGCAYMFKREYAKAESTFLTLCSSPGKSQRSIGRFELALIPMYQGKLAEALKLLDTGIAADEMEGTDGYSYRGKFRLKMDIYAETARWEEAIEQARLYMKTVQGEGKIWGNYGRYLYACLLARSGDIEEAEKEIVYFKKLGEENYDWMENYWSIAGHLANTRGNIREALEFFQKIVDDRLDPYFEDHYLLAVTLLEAGKLGEAVNILEKALFRYDELRADLPIHSARAHYVLGQAYEQSGWTEKAVSQYEEFLEIWKDADPYLEEVAEARERIRILTGAE